MMSSTSTEIVVSHEEIFNKSRYVDPFLIERYVKNRAIDEPAHTTLIVMYSILIIVGACGNTLVILSVLRKASMRTPRNMFILNLAISDLLLCTVTMPLTLMEILTKHFPLGNNAFLCKIIGTMQAMSTFVSTISITAIALDRYQVILYPTKESLQIYGAILILGLIWAIALFLALPLFVFKQLAHHVIELGELNEINFCIESWPFDHGRAYYSIFSMVLVYILPICTITIAYFRISYKLRYRFAGGFVSSDDRSQKSRQELRGRRLHRTNILLSSISIIFGISWLPLNLYNLIADFSETFSFTSQSARVGYALCHMLGMSSACSNPVLYGCFNENFLKEFREILGCCIKGGEHVDEKVSLRKQSQRTLKSPKPDLLTTDYQQGNTVSSDLTVFTKC